MQQLLSCCRVHNRFTALFWDHPGELVPEENFWTLLCKGRVTEADTLTIRQGATPDGLTSAHLQHPPISLQAGCPSLPAAQPTVLKHCRQLAHCCRLIACLTKSESYRGLLPRLQECDFHRPGVCVDAQQVVSKH